MAEAERPSFPLSDEQAKVVSCLLEIELTLTVAGAGRARSRKRSRTPAHEILPLDAMGRCDPSRAAAVLWSLNRTRGAKPGSSSGAQSERIHSSLLARAERYRQFARSFPDGKRWLAFSVLAAKLEKRARQTKLRRSPESDSGVQR